MLLNRPLINHFLRPGKSRRYRQSRIDFYNSRNKASSFASIENILFENRLNAVTTQEEINFDNIHFGDTPQALIKEKGRPNFKLFNDKTLKGLQVYFYRLTIDGIRCIQQFHFYKKKFFFGHIEFRSWKPGFEVNLQSALSNKYMIEHNDLTEVKDRNDHKVMITKGISPSISYISGQPEIKNEIREQMRKIELKRSTTDKPRMERILDMI